MRISCCLLFIMTAFFLTAAAAAPDRSDKGELKDDQQPWGQPAEGLRLSLRSGQTKYAMGDKVEVRMVVQNMDTIDRDVVDAHPLFIFEFQVKGPDGKALPLSKRGSEIQETMRGVGKRTLHTLKPKEETSFNLEFSDIYDLLTPGEYQVRASMDVHQQKDPKKWSTLTSNPLTLTITEAKENKDK